MQHILSVLSIPLWFIFQGVIVGGIGVLYFAVPFIILAILMYLGWRRAPREARSKLWIPIVVLPAIWLVQGWWAGIFWFEWAPGVQPAEAWVSYPLLAGLLCTLVLIPFFVIHGRGARMFLVSYSIINLYFELICLVMSLMAVSGQWL